MSITVAGRDLQIGDRYKDRMRNKIVTVSGAPWVHEYGSRPSDGQPMGTVLVPILRHGDTWLDLDEVVEVTARNCTGVSDPGISV